MGFRLPEGDANVPEGDAMFQKFATRVAGDAALKKRRLDQRQALTGGPLPISTGQAQVVGKNAHGKSIRPMDRELFAAFLKSKGLQLMASRLLKDDNNHHMQS